jgi:hypothetical protein
MTEYPDAAGREGQVGVETRLSLPLVSSIRREHCAALHYE